MTIKKGDTVSICKDLGYNISGVLHFGKVLRVVGSVIEVEVVCYKKRLFRRPKRMVVVIKVTRGSIFGVEEKDGN